MTKDHCEDFAGAFVGRVLREHWEGVPWETGRKKGEDQGTWRGPGRSSGDRICLSHPPEAQPCALV